MSHTIGWHNIHWLHADCVAASFFILSPVQALVSSTGALSPGYAMLDYRLNVQMFCHTHPTAHNSVHLNYKTGKVHVIYHGGVFA